MRLMRYTVSTYCLHPTSSDGDKFTLGSRDKYVFNSSNCSDSQGAAELYLFRYNDSRRTKVDQQEYQIRIFSLSSCKHASNAYATTDVNLQTGDIILGISSGTTPDPQQGGAGCSPYLYILRPIFQRNSGSQRDPTNYRNCSAGGES